MSISRINLRQLSIDEALQAATQTTTIVKDNDPKLVPQVGAQRLVVEGLLPDFATLISKDPQSAFTAKLVAADALRDRHISGIKNLAYGYSLYFTADMVAWGELVFRAIDKHGDIVRESYNAETASINEILKETNDNADLKNAIIHLNLAAWFGELKKSNDDFDKLYLSRVNEAGTQPKGNASEKRREVIVAMKKLYDNIHSAANLNDNGDYNLLINKLNELAANYNALIAKRLADKKANHATK